jgi:hypothetical protein
MGITVSCPHCDRSYTLAETNEGKTVRCKECEEPFVVRRDRAPRREPEDEEDRPRRRSAPARDEDDRPRRRPRKSGVPLWAWAVSGAALVLLLAGGLTAYLLSGGGGGGALGSPRGAGGSKLTREKFEAVKLGMSDREVVNLLGTPARARGTFGPIDHWAQLEASKTLSWEAGSTKVEVHLLGGGVHTIRGIFDDPADATPAAWTEANFRKLKWDLTCADVRALFGPPQEVYRGGTGLRGPNVTLTWRGGTEVVCSFDPDALYSAIGKLNGKTLLLNQRPLEGGAGLPKGGEVFEVDSGRLESVDSRVLEASFRKLRVKMSRQEVKDLLGAPSTQRRIGDSLVRTWRNSRDTIEVHFKDDRLVLATAYIGGKNLSVVDAPGAAAGAFPP